MRVCIWCECACQQNAHLVPVAVAEANYLAQERRATELVALQDSDNVVLATEAVLDELSGLVGLVGLMRTSLVTVVRLFGARDNTKKRERARAVADGEMV